MTIESIPYDATGSYASPHSGNYRYDLDPAELDDLEGQLVSSLHAQDFSKAPLATVEVGAEHPLANFARTYEQITYLNDGYDSAADMRPYERLSSFLCTVDLEHGAIAHTKRVVRAVPENEIDTAGVTGIEVIDDRLTASDPEEAATLEVLLAVTGIDNLRSCINIAANQQTNRAPISMQRPHVLWSYKAVFDMCRKQDIEFVLAYMNSRAIRSLGRLGVQSMLLGGKSYHLPVSHAKSGYNKEYEAVVIPATPATVAAFTDVESENRFTRLIASQNAPHYNLTDSETFDTIK